MAQSKKELLEDTSITHQEALVNRLLEAPKKTKKRVIPGGKKILEVMNNSEDWKNAIFTWLRGCRYFDAVTISMAKDPDDFKTSKEKFYDFQETVGPDGKVTPTWWTHNEGRLFLARLMAKAFDEKRLIKLEAKTDGLYAYIDKDKKLNATSDEWEPYIEFSPRNQGRY